MGAELLVWAVIALAASIVAHLALIVRILGVTGITTRQRWMAVLIPIATPVIGWMAGKKWHVILWTCLVASYVGLRVALAMR